MNHCDSIINEGIARNKKRREWVGIIPRKGKVGKEKDVKIRWKKPRKLRKGTEMQCTRARGFSTVFA